MKYQFFKEEEVKGLMINFVMLLDHARGIAGIPFVINSGFRTKQHNKEVGGVQDSAHLKGLGADIRVLNSVDRFKMNEALRQVGFNRIGHYANHIHVDCDASLPQNVMWID